ncbi:LysM peptidoglycan-binding domain-containing protein [Flavobacterium faecale]|uniref:LysM peptidoglycan-binding domain-containing protein n=1 Tax=Flavobacterium faecale TaxID=1355330 RepID=UPI003AAD4CC4
MKGYSYLIVAILFSGFTVFAQQKTTEHVVAKGETISKIAALYNLKAKDIYELNPEAKKGIKFNTKLLIPVTATAVSNEILHEVSAKETLYGISKEYGVTIEDLYKSNPALEESGLKVGQKISVIGSTKMLKSVSKAESESLTAEAVPQKVMTEGIVYEVLAKQTKYNIAKEHGITVALLEKANPILQTEELKVGQKIIIPVQKYIPEINETSETVLNKEEKLLIKKEDEVISGVFASIVKDEVVSGIIANTIVHEVLPKETKYAIAKQHRITIADLDKANPILESEGLKIGQKISIPVQELTTEKEQAVSNTDNVKLKKDTVTSDKEILVKSKDSIKVEQTEITHKVLVKETKYGIAKEYGITVKELEKHNPSIINQLRVGTVLTIKNSKISNPVAEVKQEQVVEESLDSKSIHDERFVDQLISTASENIGTRYRIGGTTKDGFDCSGLMCSTFGAFDVQLPRTSLEQSQYGTVVEVDKAQKGDLIFFKTRGRSQINHVGMVVEVADGDVKFIHASNSGVIISSIKESYYSKRVVQVNRVL